MSHPVQTSAEEESLVRRWLYREERLDISEEDMGVREAKQLAKDLATNTTLKTLQLRWNEFGDEGTIALAGALGVNKTLAALSLYDNEIGDAGMAALADALMRNDSLKEFSSGGNSFSSVAWTSLANALKINTGLTTLFVYDNSIDAEGVTILADALKVNKTLQYLDLRNNGVGDEGATSILNVLAGWNTTLTSVTLSYVSETIYSAIHSFLDGNRAGIRLLHAAGKLDLSSTFFLDSSKVIAGELAGNTPVTTLALHKNLIDDQGCAYIADALVKNCSLTSIELDDNSIGDAGCSTLAAMLAENTVLVQLVLNGNGIGLPGATSLAEALQQNACLQILGLGRNNIGNEGAMAIANALRSNTNLARLDLNCNNISDEGVMAFLVTLEQYNHTLTLLNLDNNDKISPNLRKTVDFMLMARQVLNAFCKSRQKPLEKSLIPLAIHNLWMNSIGGQRLHEAPRLVTPKRASRGQHHSARLIFRCHENPELTPFQQAQAGPIFLLVRAIALNDSKVIKVTADSRKRSRAA
jgi:Ran GTPase-activating protein (RanGAP) involved in mRNA processing and transport